jgi:proteasome accessory factor B
MSKKVSTPGAKEPDEQSERLYSLTLALIRTGVGLTKEEIFNSIRGYRFDVEAAGGIDGNLQSLDRKFNRDKEDLRRMGLQLDGAGSNEGDADYRYRISDEVYVWPKGTTLTSKQLQLLELAASVWEHAALSPEATSGITRLRAIAAIGDRDLITGIAPRVNTVEPSFAALKRAIEDLCEVSFSYRKADGTESLRTVQPWQLSHTHGLWMLLGWDAQRNAPRNYLLKRIHSKVERSSRTFERPDNAQISAAKAELLSHYESNLAKIKVTPGTTAAMHFETHGKSDGVTSINYLDLHLLAEELLEFGSSVKVLEPIELKNLIQETLRQVIHNHA